jgi:hypothetical protein
MGGLALEQSDRPGLATFLARHLACGGGTDIQLQGGEDGSMIRVTCTHCGIAIEAAAASWEGWWEERTRDAATPTRRFEPSHRRLTRRRRTTTSPRARPPVKGAGDDVWRRRVVMGLIAVWLTGGLVLLAIAVIGR